MTGRSGVAGLGGLPRGVVTLRVCVGVGAGWMRLCRPRLCVFAWCSGAVLLEEVCARVLL